MASPVLPLVEQLSPRVVRVLGLNPGKYTLQGTNTYLVGTGRRRVLIDTGEPERRDYLELLRSTLKQTKSTISDILLTHWHLDHIGGVPGVRALISGDGGQVKVSKIPLSHLAYAAKERDASFKSTLELVRELLPDNHTHLTDGTRITVEGATLVVMATPGHTPDHMSLLLEEENAVFTGDCVLGQGTARFEDLLPYMTSLKRLVSLSPTLLYPGHGPVVTDSVTHIQHYIKHREQREREVMDHLSVAVSPCSVADIVSNVYPSDLHPDLVSGAHKNIYNHLRKLEEEQRIRRVDIEGDEKWAVQSSHSELPSQL